MVQWEIPLFEMKDLFMDVPRTFPGYLHTCSPVSLNCTQIVDPNIVHLYEIKPLERYSKANYVRNT